MPRANRYFVPGYVWHITHRCHKQEFLLMVAGEVDHAHPSATDLANHAIGAQLCRQVRHGRP